MSLCRRIPAILFYRLQAHSISWTPTPRDVESVDMAVSGAIYTQTSSLSYAAKPLIPEPPPEPRDVPESGHN
ncbi:hypothetical protein CPLU01_12885 [Colletotrichum plurivorum]|uniref:Uncharacterized protein n=1 Tax=Colletotrichum plurivorum TaxID=2175906 RepID=A0A8H6JVV2_9PEZI|nr:hypothetical protein CPLU01_12885 [Colletotrichum plurivorum]